MSGEFRGLERCRHSCMIVDREAGSRFGWRAGACVEAIRSLDMPSMLNLDLYLFLFSRLLRL
jgi:hypothetical protein